MKEALLAEKTESGIRCHLCAHRCLLKEGKLGICRVRKNQGGQMVSLCYDRVAATNSDPIEKKPLYHFLPASSSFSVATMGCNFKCRFCQNHSLSVVSGEGPKYGEAIAPEQLVEAAVYHNAQSIAYTYTEPTIYFELMMETAKLAHKAGIKNIMVTNGYMTPEALDMIAPYLDAANIDLKAFSDQFYNNLCAAHLEPVLETIKGMKARDIWIELTTLLIPGLNDDPVEIDQLISFILGVDENIPWHVSRFYPQYQMDDLAPTDPSAIFEFLKKAKGMGLRYLYAGNVQSGGWSDTLCPQCNTTLIERSGYFTKVLDIEEGKCTSCGHKIAGIWE
jgi:pyruvate formate lyase activating enzyme